MAFRRIRSLCACGIDISDKPDVKHPEKRLTHEKPTDGGVEKGLDVPHLNTPGNECDEVINTACITGLKDTTVHQHQIGNIVQDNDGSRELGIGNGTISDTTDVSIPRLRSDNPQDHKPRPPSTISGQSEAESGYVSGQGSRASSLGNITSSDVDAGESNRRGSAVRRYVESGYLSMHRGSRANSQGNIGTNLGTLSETHFEREMDDGEDQNNTITVSSEYIVGTHSELDDNQELAPTSAKTTIGERDELEIILAKLDILRESISCEILKRKRVTLKRFSAAFLTGERGGTVSIDLSGRQVSLSIPPGSLKIQDEPQLVYIYVPHHQSRNPNSEKSDEAWITPNVRCGPHGLQFLKPVFLTIPVSSHIDPTTMKLSGYQKKLSDGNKGSEWKAIKEGEDAVIVVAGQEITLLLNHFCQYGCTGSSKWVKLVAFVEREEDGDRCRVIVHLQDLNSELDTKYCSASQTMEINDNGGSIQVNINGVHRSWNILDKSGQEVPFSHIWFDHSDVLAPKATVQFTAKLKDGDEFLSSDDLPSFSANIDVYQDNNHRPRVSLSVADEKTESQTYHSDASEIEQAVVAEFRKDFFEDPPSFTQPSIYAGICMALDDTAVESQGYMAFGVEVGLGVQEVRWIAKFGKHPSPSATLLDLYMKNTRTEGDVLGKLQSLSNIFSKIENHTAKRYVDQEIEERVRPTVCQLPLTQDTQNIQVPGNKEDDDPQMSSQDPSTAIRRKEKKSLRHRIKSKILGKPSKSQAKLDENAGEGKSNAAYQDDHGASSAQQTEHKQDTPVQQEDQTIGNDIVLRTLDTHSSGTEKDDIRKASGISKDSGVSSRPSSMTRSISSTSTFRPPSTLSTSTIRPLSTGSESSIDSQFSINSQAGSDGLHPMKGIVEEKEEEDSDSN